MFHCEKKFVYLCEFVIICINIFINYDVTKIKLYAIM